MKKWRKKKSCVASSEEKCRLTRFTFKLVPKKKKKKKSRFMQLGNPWHPIRVAHFLISKLSKKGEKKRERKKMNETQYIPKDICKQFICDKKKKNLNTHYIPFGNSYNVQIDQSYNICIVLRVSTYLERVSFLATVIFVL